MRNVREIVDDYPYLAMDTEFPGIVARPVGKFKNSGEYQYQTLRYSLSDLRRLHCKRRIPKLEVLPRCNVDMLKLIQLGLTFSDEEGNLPRCQEELSVWQFNFRWV